ncbi:ABC transporter ATP-binding protein [Xenorhabdus japonica]|uniref:Uncharacterized protein n=1 Tax=Xenorhabdus japonica TaxID=53341 RepID=A0A1I5DDH1_9GAMM|nr:hypothetical protein [Xenorhabdus japonica]SFN96841.1 hypothetical protein SAMN05421579_13811 [Xenorhabdus japonica]
MKKIFSNKFFLICLVLICLQQVLVGLSTYFIGLAGEKVATLPMEAFYYTAMFFLSIFIAYLFGSASLFYRVKLSNNLWERYYSNTLTKISKNHSISTEENKRTTQLWLSGEALSTLDEAGFAFIEILAIYFNVLFTTIALFAILGTVLTSVIVFCMFLSVVFLYLSKSKIGIIASSMQNEKIAALHAISKIWDNMFYGDKKSLASALVSSKQKVDIYFKKTESYKTLEQIISCAPILISIPLLVLFSYYQILNNTVAIGALVAVLPRTLQLFQNIHAASMSTSQIMLLKNKIQKLYLFSASLKGYNYLASIDNEKISVIDLINDQILDVHTFIELDLEKALVNGRYLISGSNGAGKSSLLKYTKSKYPDALFFGPNIQVGEDTVPGSTGQKQLYQMALLSNIKHRIIFLDEWDANLDESNTQIIDKFLTSLAEDNLIIEIRH